MENLLIHLDLLCQQWDLRNSCVYQTTLYNCVLNDAYASTYNFYLFILLCVYGCDVIIIMFYRLLFDGKSGELISYMNLVCIYGCGKVPKIMRSQSSDTFFLYFMYAFVLCYILPKYLLWKFSIQTKTILGAFVYF